MYYKKYLESVEKNKLKSVVLLYGEEHYILEKIIESIKLNYIGESFQELNYLKIDGGNIDLMSLMDQCEQMPFMSDRKVIIVENLTLFEKSMDSEEKFYNYIGKSNQAILLVFVLKDIKLDKRKKIYKAINKAGEVIEFKKLGDSDLLKWIRLYFESKNKSIGVKEQNYIVELLGYGDKNSKKTLYDVKNELDKLLDFIGDDDYIRKESIDKVFVKSLQNNIFELVDWTTSKKKGRAEQLLQDMLLKNEPINLIIFMITKQYRNLLFAKALIGKGYNQNDIASKLGVHKFVASKLMNQLSKFSVKQLKESYRLCLNTDRMIKTGELDAKLAVEILIAKL